MEPAMPSKHFTRLFAFAICCLVQTGCGNGDLPKIGEVQGTITVDGKPTGDIVVAFTQTGFRSSRGFTDQNGHYELNYVKDIQGAVVGEHSVKLRLMGGESGPMPKQLPAKYNRESELVRTVEPGMNQIDFDLVTK